MQPPRNLRLITTIALLAAMACGSSSTINVQAGLDINNQGGAILGLSTDSTVRLNAGRDITIQSITVDTNSVTSAQNKYGTNLIAFDSTQVTNVTTFPKPPLAPKFGRTGP